MPVPAVIATAAENYHFNSNSLEQAVSDLSPEEWLKRPDEKLNHMAWIVGHLAYCRGRTLHFINVSGGSRSLRFLAAAKNFVKTPPTRRPSICSASGASPARL